MWSHLIALIWITRTAPLKQQTATEEGHPAFLPTLLPDLVCGRMFIAPYSPEANPEVWINIGWFGEENNEDTKQVYPQYFAAPFEGVIHETQWMALFADIKQYVAEEALPEQGTCDFLNDTGKYITASGTYFALLMMVRSRISGIQKIVARHAAGWPVGEHAVCSDYWGDSQTSFEELRFEGAFDQFGVFEPYWPPMGYNIIIRMPQKHEELRRAWPCGNTSLFHISGLP